MLRWCQQWQAAQMAPAAPFNAIRRIPPAGARSDATRRAHAGQARNTSIVTGATRRTRLNRCYRAPGGWFDRSYRPDQRLSNEPDADGACTVDDDALPLSG